MSGFLRPEAAQALSRWREVLIALAVVALGAWIAFRPGPIVQGFGYVLIAVGAVGLIPALRRARFQGDGQGPGVVKIDEGRILFMGPVTGGTVAIRELTSLSLRRDGDGQAAWVLVEPGALLTIPTNAQGADALFDAFTALPGLSAQRLLAVLSRDAPGTDRVWVRQTDTALPRR
jgi:hypothetical protein